MPRRERPALAVEAVESRVLLTRYLPEAPLPHAEVLNAPGRVLALGGRLRGTYEATTTTDGSAIVYTLHGAGRVRHLGRVTISGTLPAAGTTSAAVGPGTVVLTNRRGSLTVNIVGPESHGRSPAATRYPFVAGGGLGRYSGLHGFGSLVLKTGPAHWTASGPATRPVGRFSMELMPNLPRR